MQTGSTQRRNKPRGGLGKYLRASGRGRGRGRGAAFTERLVLDDEETIELTEEEAQTLESKFARRTLYSNADRYAESEPPPNSDQESEPEVDLSGFLALQRARPDTENDHLQISPLTSTTPALSRSLKNVGEEASDDDVDHTLAVLMSSSGLRKSADSEVRKGNKRVVEWGEDMETMQRETKAAEAMRDLKSRLQGSSKFGSPPLTSSFRAKRGKSPIAGHRVPADEVQLKEDDMEAFLDDLLG
ncbi:hypothetical protein BS47DRAFT_1484705 [Hydnum rufescens UP504]|uniref:Uncharacterized protein n=1 Tax=Hydnum rufescens UP504 TaxID=1448309 RepID=A0A9P6DXZ4_9AGAM|nr:hypothetical protein BS47DRAFT_1484705 [Hydnum rufescens UP504]